MIGTFPNFTPISVRDKHEILRHTLGQLPYSDFNFTSLISWNTAKNTELAEMNGNLIIKIDDYISHKPIYAFFGKQKVAESMEKLLKYIENSSEAEQATVELVPEFCIHENNQSEEGTNIVTIEDRNNFDYIYSTKQLAESKGRKYETIRNQINRFDKKYGDVTKIVELDLKNDEHASAVLSLVEKWNAKKDQTDKTENRAIQNFIRYADHPILINTGIYIENKLAAFCFNEPLTHSYALSHFAKADTQFVGIYSKLAVENAKKIYTHGYEFLNYEQDLGIESLRHAKLQMRPHSFLKKYKVSIDNNSDTKQLSFSELQNQEVSI